MQHWTYKFCYKLMDNATYEMLTTVHRNEALSHPCVFKCCKQCREGWKEPESDPEGGQLLAVQNTVTVAKVCEPEVRDCHQTTPQLTGRWCVRFFIKTSERRSAWHHSTQSHGWAKEDLRDIHHSTQSHGSAKEVPSHNLGSPHCSIIEISNSS